MLKNYFCCLLHSYNVTATAFEAFRDSQAGAIGIEHLVKKAKESAAHRKDAIPAVGSLVGLRQEFRRQERAEELFQVGQTLLAKILDALTQGGQARAPGRKKGS